MKHKNRKGKYGIGYQITRFVFLALYIAAMGVLVYEAAQPSKESGRKSDAAGIALSNIINDFNGDTAIELYPEECNIIISKAEFAVGETTTLNVETIPEESTYKSYTFSSSDPTVADVNEFGEVSFLKAGTAEITAKNTKIPTVFSSVTVTVKNVELESFTSKINASVKSGVYQLKTNHSYVVTNTFKPTNATFKDVTYEYDTGLGYIEMENDTIKALNSSGGDTFDLIVHCGSLANILKLTTFVEEPEVDDYPLVGLKASNVSKYVDQAVKFRPVITYNPTYVSSQYKGYTLSSSDDSIVTVEDDYLVPTKTVGTANITVTSTKVPEITTTFTYKTLERPTLVSVSISKYSSTMYVGATQTISVSTNPSSNLYATKTLSSSNTSVATVTNNGVVTGKAVGSTIITATVKDNAHNITKEASVTITVEEAPVYIVNDIEIGYKHGEVPVLYAGEATNLKDYFYIKTYVGNSNPANKNYVFYIDTNIYHGTLEDETTFTPTLNGKVYGYLSYTNENDVVISKEIAFIVVSRFDITDSEENVISADTLYVRDRKQYSIKTTNSYGQWYRVINNNTDIITTSFDGSNISVYIKQAGSSSFKVIPVISVDDESFEVDSQSKTVSLTSNHRYTTSIGLHFFNSKKEEVEFSTTENNMIYVNQRFTYTPAVDLNTTLSDVVVKSSNEELLEIKNNTIIPKKIGDLVITVKETHSDLSVQYRIKVRNHVVLNEKKAFAISGFYDFDAETNTLTIINGDSVTVRYNFDKSSTYRKTTYEMSDESVALIGTDGTITPLKVGQTTLKMIVKDELSMHAENTINIVIVRKNFIQNMHDFLIKVRKGIGHFGAFMVLGLFAAVTYFMFFRKEMFLFGLGINLSSGYFFAALTEEIQRHTPGRTAAMSDVVIDFRGYIIGVAVVTGIILIVATIKFFVRRHKKKSEENNNK